MVLARIGIILVYAQKAKENKSIMATRSIELIEVGYFLSRAGKKLPPIELNTSSWYNAYMIFYNKLNGGRTPSEFENSLKNIRDQFDGYFSETMREGWKSPTKPNQPAKLSTSLKSTFDKFESTSLGVIWGKIKKYADFTFIHSKAEINDAFLPNRFEYYESRTVYLEGKKKARISNYIERNPQLRRLAIKHHGANCAACGFNFQDFYGDFAVGFIEIHHLLPLHMEENNRRETNYMTDLIPLCSNCHSVVHRKQDSVISLEELVKMIKMQQ
jgi:5-methylcytosine-specific restriction protein A